MVYNNCSRRITTDSLIKSIYGLTLKICICPPMRLQGIILDYINQINTLEVTATTTVK